MTREGLLSVQDVSKLLNVSRRTLYSWIQKGVLQPTRIGKLYRFHPDDINALIEKGRVVTNSAEPKKIVILAIDDDLLVRKSLKILLEKSGFEIDCVEGGLEALQKMQTKRYDLILTDVRMPGMDGLETLKAIRRLRSEEGKPVIPEIAISAYNDEPVRFEMEKMGVKEFVLKPFEWDKFLSTIQQTLN